MLSKLRRMDDKLDLIMWQLAKLSKDEERILRMSAETDAAVQRMTDQLNATKAGVDSAVVLLNSIPALMASSGVPASVIDNFTQSLKTNMQPLLDAVAADGPQPAPSGPVVVEPPPSTPSGSGSAPGAPGTAGMARGPRGG